MSQKIGNLIITTEGRQTSTKPSKTTAIMDEQLRLFLIIELPLVCMLLVLVSIIILCKFHSVYLHFRKQKIKKAQYKSKNESNMDKQKIEISDPILMKNIS